MLKKIIGILLLLSSITNAQAQTMDAFVHQGEIGVSAGVGHYFGDLNPNSAINRPKLAAGIFFRKQLSNYIGVRVSGDFAMLGYSDVYSSNPVQNARNLSFNTNVWELSLAGEKYILRLLGTEGQGSALYPNLQPYNPIAISIPFTLGIKQAINASTNVFAELTYRFTNTDYLDDVSGLYAPDAFPALPDGSPSPAFLLQDRSYETGSSIGIKGKQRGNSLQKDAFATFKVGVSFNLQTYRCPSPSMKY